MERDVEFKVKTSGFERYHFGHCALPDIDKDEIDISTLFLSKQLKAALIIGAMTGGTELGDKINRNLASAAQELGIGMMVGSQRIAIEEPSLAPTLVLYLNLLLSPRIFAHQILSPSSLKATITYF